MAGIGGCGCVGNYQRKGNDMSKAITTTQFDYAMVDEDTKGKLIWYAAEIQRQGVSHVETGLEMGRLLTESRDLCNDKKTFEMWVDRECRHSIRTAYNYMSAFEHFGSCAKFAQIELSAMYELAKNEIAKNRALKLADKGQRITYSVAKDLVSDAQKPPKAEPKKPPVVAAVVPSEESIPWDDVDESIVHSDAVIVGEDEGVPVYSTYDTPEPDVDEPASPPDGQCPACAGSKWTSDEFGWICAKCNHPHGEPAGEVEDERITIQRAKTRKTVEALMRAFDDLHLLCQRSNEHAEVMESCKWMIQIAKDWK